MINRFIILICSLLVFSLSSWGLFLDNRGEALEEYYSSFSDPEGKFILESDSLKETLALLCKKDTSSPKCILRDQLSQQFEPSFDEKLVYALTEGGKYIFSYRSLMTAASECFTGGQILFPLMFSGLGIIADWGYQFVQFYKTKEQNRIFQIGSGSICFCSGLAFAELMFDKSEQLPILLASHSFTYLIGAGFHAYRAFSATPSDRIDGLAASNLPSLSVYRNEEDKLELHISECLNGDNGVKVLRCSPTLPLPNFFNAQKCGVCLEEFSGEDPQSFALIIGCGHVACSGCLKAWVESRPAGNVNCPFACATKCEFVLVANEIEKAKDDQNNPANSGSKLE